LYRLIRRYNTVSSLKSSLEKEIEETEQSIHEYSNVLGEKIRTNEELSKDDPEFMELKSKLENNPADKKKLEAKVDEPKKSDKKSNEKKSVEKPKKPSKKGSEHWYNLDHIMVYNGIGLKGELELYFKAIDELKSKLETLQRTLSALNNIIEKGLKEDMACIAFHGSNGPLQISFLKSSDIRKNFSFKSIYSGAAISQENIIKIGV
jgi:DNA repair exonuclease SbcCD ATPase subunit